MSDNYYFQNRGLVGVPINMKKVVLDILRNYGIFIHMRDEPRDKYDLKDFLYETNPMGIPYHLDIIERAKNKIKECEKHLEEFKSNGDALYQKYYDDGWADYKQLMESNKYYHQYCEAAANFHDTINIIESFITTFVIESQPNLTNIVKENLTDCITTLKKDEQHAIDAANDNNVNQHSSPYAPLKKEAWLQSKITECKDVIKWNKERIKEEKKAIKNLQEKDKIIRAIFTALEPYDIKE